MIIQKTEKVLLSTVESGRLDFVMRMISEVHESATSPTLKECAKKCLASLSDFIDFTDYYDYVCDSDDSEKEEEREGEDLFW